MPTSNSKDFLMSSGNIGSGSHHLFKEKYYDPIKERKYAGKNRNITIFNHYRYLHQTRL